MSSALVGFYWDVGVFLVQFLQFLFDELSLAGVNQKVALIEIFYNEVVFLVQQEKELLHGRVTAKQRSHSRG